MQVTSQRQSVRDGVRLHSAQIRRLRFNALHFQSPREVIITLGETEFLVQNPKFVTKVTDCRNVRWRTQVGHVSWLLLPPLAAAGRGRGRAWAWRWDGSANGTPAPEAGGWSLHLPCRGRVLSGPHRPAQACTGRKEAEVPGT